MTKNVKLIVIFFPILFFILGASFQLPKFENDPNYVYLVNATALCKGKSVSYIDHPGTTVMQISAAIIAIKHFIFNPENVSLETNVLNNPHSFIEAIRMVFLFINSIVLFFLGWIAFKKTKSIWISLLLQASIFITTNSLNHFWTKVSPAPILFFISCVYIIIFIYFYKDEIKTHIKYPIIFALIVGAGLVTKATFLPMAFFPLVVIPSIRNKMIYFGGILVSFVLFSIPIIPEYENMYYWFRNLSSHSGIYGHGEKGFIDWQTYFPNILNILINNPIFALVNVVGSAITISAIAQFLTAKKQHGVYIKLLFGFIVSSGIGILMVAKHYHSNHYLIPVLLLTGPILYLILKILAPKSFNKAISFAFFVLIMFLIWQQPQNIKYAKDGYKLTNEEIDSTNMLIKTDYADYTKVYHYPNSLNPYSALNFGDVYSQRKMLPHLKYAYGDIYFYYTFEQKIKNWDLDSSIEEIIQKNGNKVLLIGGPQNKNDAANMWQQNLPLIPIHNGRIQAIYRLDTLRYKQILSNQFTESDIIVHCDAEMVSSDNQYYLGSNGELLVNASSRSNETSKSGDYAIKMGENTEFALEYILTNLKEGDIYEAEVWRKAESSSGHLVIASEDAKTFYKAQNHIIKEDEYGWGLIRISFQIPPELDGKKIKVYLWNMNKQLTFFDDLSIKKINNKETNKST